jgi:hypothetical protein
MLQLLQLLQLATALLKPAPSDSCCCQLLQLLLPTLLLGLHYYKLGNAYC